MRGMSHNNRSRLKFAPISAVCIFSFCLCVGSLSVCAHRYAGNSAPKCVCLEWREMP